MTPQETITALEALGVTRYRIACDTGIDSGILCRVASGKRGMAERNHNILLKYYEKTLK
jgi:hypothetical protein